MGTGGHPDYIWLLANESTTLNSKWSNDRGVAYTTLPIFVPLEYFRASFVTWNSGILQTALIASATNIWHWAQGAAAWTEKTGNLDIYGVGAITEIQRDSMGSA